MAASQSVILCMISRSRNSSNYSRLITMGMFWYSIDSKSTTDESTVSHNLYQDMGSLCEVLASWQLEVLGDGCCNGTMLFMRAVEILPMLQ